MSEESLFTKEIVYKLKEMDEVIVKHNLPYAEGENNELLMDIYYRKNAKAGELRPAVIFITGYPDPGFKAMTGYKLKELKQYTSWARLMAASGYIAITYANVDPVTDAKSLLEYIAIKGSSLGIDKEKICVWACSGNTPNALSLLMDDQNAGVKSAVLCYGYMPDLGESTLTADMAKQFYFVNPCPKPVGDRFPWKRPLLLVRCGLDKMPGLNVSMDQFIAVASAQDLPLNLINLAEAPHAFDIMDNHEYAQKAIKDILSFVKSSFGN